MLHRLGVILLAGTVLVANAYCACVPVVDGAARSRQTEAQEPSHSGCHGHDKKSSDGPGQDEHNCGHCTGTVSADMSSGKTSLNAPHLSPLHWFSTTSADLVAEVRDVGHSFDHSGLSPPVASPTLLNLFCSFIN